VAAPAVQAQSDRADRTPAAFSSAGLGHHAYARPRSPPSATALPGARTARVGLAEQIVRQIAIERELDPRLCRSRLQGAPVRASRPASARPASARLAGRRRGTGGAPAADESPPRGRRRSGGAPAGRLVLPSARATSGAAISSWRSSVLHRSNSTPRLSRDSRLASSRNRNLRLPVVRRALNRFASRSHSVSTTIMTAAPTPIASPVDSRVGAGSLPVGGGLAADLDGELEVLAVASSRRSPPARPAAVAPEDLVERVLDRDRRQEQQLLGLAEPQRAQDSAPCGRSGAARSGRPARLPN